MAYEPYVTSDYYKNEYGGTIVPEEQLAKALRQASRHIDTLTYNRIVGQGFSNLTAFQQDMIREVVCQQADFEVENADMINTVLQSYSINGVAMQFLRRLLQRPHCCLGQLIDPRHIQLYR